MNSAESAKLTAVTMGFTLAAAVTVVFNTVLAWAKDAYAPLSDLMKALTGHHWTTHGLADLIVFVGLGTIFTRLRTTRAMGADRLAGILVGAVTVSALGLILWFAFV